MDNASVEQAVKLWLERAEDDLATAGTLLEIAPPNRILDAMIEIDKFYLTARYPSYKEFVNITDEKTAKRIFENTKESYEWLKQTLTL